MNNLEIVNNFIDYYAKHDSEGIKRVMRNDVTWYFLGGHKLAGIKNGIDELIAFFDKVGSLIGNSKPSIEKLIVAANDKYVIECQHLKSNTDDEKNTDHVCILWTIENGKIISGRHLFADATTVDEYFNSSSTDDHQLLNKDRNFHSFLV
jgi:ketosteroid isomerase-like protein